MIDYKINFSQEKNQLLKVAREINFDDVLLAISTEGLVGHVQHFKSAKYKNQYLLLVEVNDYIHVVPYVKNVKKREFYLKTVYPSRKFTKMYKEGNGPKKR